MNVTPSATNANGYYLFRIIQAFISRPMDWEKAQRTLKKRQYSTIGAIVDELRLIFTNAEKYNARWKGSDTVNGRAFESARIMSIKLEMAVSKMLLTVSDRLERERIDHANAEREIEAAERAEEVEIRATWKKQNEADFDRSVGMSSAESDTQHKTRIVRRLPQRRQTTDFEIPFFDEEDNGQHERADVELVKFQKARFEKQRNEMSKMRKTSSTIGVVILTRLLQRRIAKDEYRHEVRPQPDARAAHTFSLKAQQDENSSSYGSASAVLTVLEQKGRAPMQLTFTSHKVKKKCDKSKLTFSDL